MSTSEITKHAIATAFEDLLETTPLERVSVAAIAKQAGINRQTFYYHFHDIHDLLIWIYRSAARQALGTANDPNDLYEALLVCLQSLKSNQSFVVRTVHKIDTPFAYRFTYDEVSEITGTLIRGIAQGLDISQQDLALVTRFYTVELVETVYGWVADGMREEPEHLARRITVLLDGTVEGSLRRLARQEPSIT